MPYSKFVTLIRLCQRRAAAFGASLRAMNRRRPRGRPMPSSRTCPNARGTARRRSSPGGAPRPQPASYTASTNALPSSSQGERRDGGRAASSRDAPRRIRVGYARRAAEGRGVPAIRRRANRGCDLRNGAERGPIEVRTNADSRRGLRGVRGLCPCCAHDSHRMRRSCRRRES